MASPAYEQILVVQALDMSIRQLEHRSAIHPARARAAEVDERLAGHDGVVAGVEERKHGLAREQKRLEDEVALIEAKRLEVDGKLYGGEITASKELLALQEEAAKMLERQRGLEDEQLALMEAMEQVDGELDAMSQARTGLMEERASLEAELAEATGEIEAEIERLEAERVVGAEPANPELLARYENLRNQYDGVAVARLTDGRCDGCHIQLSAVAVDQAMKMPDDAVVSCEECGRLLVR